MDKFMHNIYVEMFSQNKSWFIDKLSKNVFKIYKSSNWNHMYAKITYSDILNILMFAFNLL